MPTILNETEDEVDYAMEEGVQPPVIRGKIISCKLSPKEQLIISNSLILPKKVNHAFTDKTGKITRFNDVYSDQDVNLPKSTDG